MTGGASGVERYISDHTGAAVRGDLGRMTAFAGNPGVGAIEREAGVAVMIKSFGKPPVGGVAALAGDRFALGYELVAVDTAMATAA